MENPFPGQNQGPIFENREQQLKQPAQPLYGSPNVPGSQVMLPNAASILILGIVACASNIIYFFGGIPGIISGIVALRLAKKATDLILQNPGVYKNASLSMVRSGRTCAIIGLIISSCIFLLALIVICVAVTK